MIDKASPPAGTIDLEKALQAAPDKAISTNAAKIAKALPGVIDLPTLYNARGQAHLPGGLATDIFQVVAYLEGVFKKADDKATKAATPAAPAAKE